MAIDKSQEIPAWESHSLKVAAEVTDQLSKKSPRIKSRRGEWLSTKQYAECENITESAATKRLARAFSKNYYAIEDLSFQRPSDALVVRCVTSAKGTKKYEVLLSSLPDYEPVVTDNSVNDADAFSNDISSFLVKLRPSLFCDWLTVSQEHFDVELPPTSGGLFIVTNEDFLSYQPEGEDLESFLDRIKQESIENIARKYLQCEGSWDSRVFIRVVGNRVDLHGNIGKYGRPDNLFGYSLQDCFKIANQVLAERGLPPFSAGTYYSYFSQSKGERVEGWTGARISRIDLTTNLTFGCPEDTKEYLGWLATQHISRMRNHVHPDGNTIEIGYSKDGNKSSYLQMLAYNKSVEFDVHSAKKIKKLTKRFEKGDIVLDLDYTNAYYENLSKYMSELGVARLELRFRKDYLKQHPDVRYLGALQKDFDQLNEIFYERWASATREFVMKEISQMSAKEQDVYALYLAGVDLKQRYKKSAFYNKRNLLLDYGIDISVPYSGETTAPKIKDMRSLQVRSLPVPDFYYLPKVA